MSGGSGKRYGFTLIELLVVVSVIAVLIGILLPTLGAATEASRLVYCQSNLRQWGVAAQVYASDFDGYLPGEGPAILTVHNREGDGYWFNALPPLIGAPAYAEAYDGTADPREYANPWVWYCPTQVRLRKNSGSNKNAFHYSMNAVLNGTPSRGPNYGELLDQKHTRRLAIREPTATLLLAESRSMNPNLVGSNAPVMVGGELRRYQGLTELRHREGVANVLMVDAAVRTVDAWEANIASTAGNGRRPWRTLDDELIWGPFRN